MTTKPQTLKETRTFKFASKGDGDGNTSTFNGYAALFNSPSRDLGGYTEVIHRDAFSATDMSECVLNINHDENRVLARMGVNLALTTDEQGLRFDAIVSKDLSYVNDLTILMRDGIISECSFAFTVADDNWSQDLEGNITRQILAVRKLYDVSVVTIPAYKGTSATVRSFDEASASGENVPKTDDNTDTLREQRERELELLKMEGDL